MSNLYDLKNQWLYLYELMDDPDVDADTVLDTIEGVDGEIEIKADGYAKVIAQLNADAEALKKESERLNKRRTTIENNITRLKSALQMAMQATGKTKFKTELFSFGIQKNPPSVVIDEPDIGKIPGIYLVLQKPQIDKSKLKEDLKNGVNLSGLAHLEQTEGLRIR